MAFRALKGQKIILYPVAESRFGAIYWPIPFNKRLFLCALCVSSVSSVVKFLFVFLVAVDSNFDAITLVSSVLSVVKKSFFRRKMPRMNTKALKQQAGEYAAAFVESGMIVGLGSGSTAIFATRRIAERIHSGELTDILAVPTSLATEAAAIELGIPLTILAEHPRIDITIDGADEIDPNFNLIKGGGGAHLREKIGAQATERLGIVADDSKLVDQLGASWAVPVEVIPFGWQSQAAYLASLGAAPKLRMDSDAPFETDQGNIILDADFGRIADPAALDITLNARAGLVEHGLFINMTKDVVVASGDGIRHLRR